MIKIAITEIKTFLSRASAIKTDTLIPISAFIRIKGEQGKVSMCKGSQHAFLIHEFDSDNEDEFDFLIEEKSLSIAIDYTNSGDCIFEELDGSIKTIVGSYEQTSASEDLKSFYKFPEFDRTFQYELGGDVLNAINAASKYAHNGKEFVSNLCFVHLQNNTVFATDNKKSFFKKFKEPLPKLTLSLNTCAILSKFGSVETLDIPTHCVFNVGSSIYGFSKEAYDPPNFQKAYDTIQEIKRSGFNISKDQMHVFADKSYKLSNGFLDTIEISDSEQGIRLDFKSDTVKASTFTVMEAEKEKGYSEPTSFLVSASILKQVLSSMSKEQVHVCFATHLVSNYLIFSEDQNHISFIMGMTA
jgi:hypothetical protein